ncbi:hypothetical protein CapIbe_017440 [Capra ibex]
MKDFEPTHPLSIIMRMTDGQWTLIPPSGGKTNSPFPAPPDVLPAGSPGPGCGLTSKGTGCVSSWAPSPPRLGRTVLFPTATLWRGILPFIILPEKESELEMLMELPSSRPKSLAEVNAVPCVLCRSAVDGADTNALWLCQTRLPFCQDHDPPRGPGGGPGSRTAGGGFSMVLLIAGVELIGTQVRSFRHPRGPESRGQLFGVSWFRKKSD